MTWQANMETLFWLSQDAVRGDVERGRAEDESGQTLSETRVRARLGRSA